MDPTQTLLEALIAIKDGNDKIAGDLFYELYHWMSPRNPKIKPDLQKVFDSLKAGKYIK